MNLYLDSSALAKLYVNEPETPDVAAQEAAATAVGTSALTRVEVPAAIGRAVVGRRLPPEAGEAARAEFQRDWPDYQQVFLTSELLTRAAELAWARRLRGADAIHLVCALEWQEQLGEPVSVMAYDGELTSAPVQKGLTVCP